MKLLTIGEFARAATLSPKALRLYDEQGLLRPHAVDSWSGYRYYAPDQLERARLIARLRRLGMPLARIGAVVDLPPAGARAAVADFLKASEAEFSERQRLAQSIIGYLSEGTPAAMTVSTVPAPLAVRYAAGSDRGLVRERNQDAAYAGPLGAPDSGSGSGNACNACNTGSSGSPLLLAVADGCGPGGEQASALAIDALRRLRPAVTPADLLTALSDAVAAAASAVCSLAADGATDNMTGSTLTAMCWAGPQLALAHVGDSRAYLLRDGGLFQLTRDDTVTQAMVDAGQLTQEEAAAHPQRSLLVKAIGALDAGTQAPSLSLREARAGDRYLLCSDGLTSVVSVPVIRGVLRDTALSPQEVIGRLTTLANGSGGPDNVACAVADLI